MESQMASWQVENFSNSAEYSPPISPSPPSPTLYSNAHQGDFRPKPQPTRSRLASGILQDLELENFTYNSHHVASNEMAWDEESISLELFEDLDNFEFSSRPPTPDSQEFKNQEHLRGFDESPQPSPSAEFPSENFDEYSAEFQSILASLHTQVTSSEAPIHVVSFPGTLNHTQWETYISNLATSDDAGGANGDDSCESGDEGSDGNQKLDSNPDDSHTFMEFEMVGQGLEENIQIDESFSPNSSSSQSCILSDSEDEMDNTSQSILDALLQGDLFKAKSFITPSIMSPTQSTSVSLLNETSSSSHFSCQKKSKRPAPSRSNTSKGGSKSGVKKPRLPSSTDKAQRKKEQNKTAATRYREKRKLQAAIVTVQESDLEKINDELKVKRDDLRRQVLIYKELLRAVMTDRKIKNLGQRSLRQ